MLSLEEIKSINRQYRYKFDAQTKTHVLINSSTKQPVFGAEAQRAKLAIYLQKKIYEGVTPQGDFRIARVEDSFYNTNDIQQREQMYLDSAVKELGKLLANKQTYRAGANMLGTCKNPLNDCLRGYTSSQTTDSDKEGFSLFLAEIAKDRGLKLESFDCKIVNAGFETEFVARTIPLQKTMPQNINPNTNDSPVLKSASTQTTIKQNNPQLTLEQSANRLNFATTLVDKYRQIEDDENYRKRATGEERTAQKVVEVLKKGKFETFPKDPHAFMRMLIAAQNISFEGGRDFFAELIAMPEVNKALLQIKNREKLKTLMDSTIEQKKQNGEKLYHKETDLETSLRLANSSSINHPEEFKEIVDVVSNNDAIDFEDNYEGQRKHKITKLVALTQGNLDMYRESQQQMQ